MKILTILLLTLSLSFTSCFSEDETRRWIIEIKDQCKTEFSTQILTTIATDLDGKAYVISLNKRVILQEVAKFKGDPVHRFILPTENLSVRVGDGKVSMRFNPPNSDGLYNADFLLFLYQQYFRQLLRSSRTPGRDLK
jgi:hypothetical protein